MAKNSTPTEPPASKSPPGPAWKRLLATAVRDSGELLDRLELPGALAAGARRASGLFPVVVPEGFLRRMARGDPGDPLLRQVLPDDTETTAVPGFVLDPVGDLAATRAPGLIQKYHGRALLVISGSCAVNCRYCFRRHFPYEESPRGLRAWEPALDALASDPELGEVILSGGDPLLLTDTSLEQLVSKLACIPHLSRLRIHSRLPIVLPERVNDELLAWLTGSRLSPVMVVHANHPREIDPTCAAALARLVDAGVTTLNQAVLLRGVNDNADTLAALSERLLDCRVLPYYLHQLDPVAGAAHFEVPVEEGVAIMAELRRRLPGYAVPRYVREVAGAPHKVELCGGPE